MGDNEEFLVAKRDLMERRHCGRVTTGIIADVWTRDGGPCSARPVGDLTGVD